MKLPFDIQRVRQFIIRNKQIFFTGLIIGFIFLIIIASSNARKVKGPTLAPSTQDARTNQQNQQGLNSGSNYKPKGLWNKPLPEEAYDKEEAVNEEENLPTEAPTEILEITFDDSGFKPMNARAAINQTVRWTNKSSKKIGIVQMKNFFPEFSNPVDIEPNGSLEFKLTKLGVWGYQDKESGEMGSIFIAHKLPASN